MSEVIIDNELSCSGIIDSHAHYFDRRFANEIDGGADRLLKEKVFPSGIEAIINVGTDPNNAQICIDQAKKYPNMYAAIGVHPTDCQHIDDDVDTAVGKIRSYLDTDEKRAENKIVAVGEIGYDYYWQPVDKDRQRAFFEAQLRLAREFSMPVIIHDRDAHGDSFETVLKYPDVVGVFHSYSGSAEMAKELIKRGWYISFSGVLTFKNARKTVEVAETVPLERILIETDCPYLTPHPHRGKINSSDYMCYTAATLANIKGVTYETAVQATSDNARRLFGLNKA